MRIPTNPADREDFYLDLIQKCMVSREERRSDYSSLRSWYLFGAGPEESPAHYNKIYPHIDQLTSFLYSSETTRFSINLGASVHQEQHKKIPVLTQALNDEWLNSNADQVFSMALTWSLCFNSTFIKLIYNNGIHRTWWSLVRLACCAKTYRTLTAKKLWFTLTTSPSLNCMPASTATRNGKK